MREHRLRVTIERDSVRLSIICPHDHEAPPDRSAQWPTPECTGWVESLPGEPCLCDCDPCREGDHGDCESEYVENIGIKWCQARPSGECWYAHAMNEVDMDAYTAPVPIVLDVAVNLIDYSWDEPIIMEAASS